MNAYDLTPVEKQLLCDAVCLPVHSLRKDIKEGVGRTLPELTEALDKCLEELQHEQWANVEKALGERML